MGKYNSQLKVHLLYFLIPLSIFYDLRKSSAAYIFSKDLIENREVLFHTNCQNEVQLNTQEFQDSGLLFTIYDFKLDLKEEITWYITKENPDQLFLLMCPNNISGVIEHLENISALMTVENQFGLNFFFIKANEFVLSGKEEIMSLLHEENTQKFIKSFPMNADIYLSVNCSNSGMTSKPSSFLIELYSVKGDVPVAQVILDNFSSHKMNHENIIRKVARRLNFHGAPIRGVIFTDKRYNSQFSIVHPMQKFEMISKALNFTALRVGGLNWIGKGNETTVFPLTGMGQQILSGEADIVVQDVELLDYRAKYLYMGPMYMPTKLLVVFRQPPRNLIRNIYIKAFQPEVWLMYLLMLVVWMVSIYVALSITAKRKTFSSGNARSLPTNSDEDRILQETFLWLIGSVLMKGLNTHTSPLSLKIIYISGLILVIVLYTFYASSLFSILSHQKEPIQNFEDFTTSEIPVVLDERALQAFEVVEKLYSKRRWDKREVVKVDPPTATNILLSDSNVAIVSEKEIWFQSYLGISEFTANDICQQFSKLEIEMGATFGAGSYVYRNTSIRKFITYPLFLLIENGIRYRQNKFMEFASAYRCLANLYEVPGLRNQDVFTAYILLGLGFVGSFLFLMKERVYSYYTFNSDSKYKS